MNSKRHFLWFFMACLLLASTAQAKVGIVVNKDLYPLIKDSLTTYINDLRTIEGKEVWLCSDRFDDTHAVTELKETLQYHYRNDDLEGAVFIGDLPIALLELEKTFMGTGVSPSDLYYMDMDGLWEDKAAWGWDRIFDTLPSNLQAEIWVSRITAGITPMLGEEEDIVNRYFARVHQRMTGGDNIPHRYLVLGNTDDWGGGLNTYGGFIQSAEMGYANEEVTKYLRSDQADTGNNWLKGLREGYESALLVEHSWANGHCTTGSYFLSDTLQGMTSNGGQSPNVRFYNLFACSNALFTSKNFLSGSYAWGHNGLISVGSTKTGSMLSFEKYNRPLGQGKSFGEAFKAWMNGRGVYDLAWHGGMSLMGVGTLKMLPYDEAKTVTVTAIAGAGGTISPGGKVPVIVGKDQRFTITASSGYRVADVRVNHASVGAVSSYTFTSLESDQAISATFTAQNQKPVARAGIDQIVPAGALVSLNGSASKDPDDGIASYRWSQVSGPSVQIAWASSSRASFVAQNLTGVNQSLTFRLTVTDRAGASSFDDCTVVVKPVANKAPVASAGMDQTVKSGTAVVLDGTASTDPDDGIAHYLWTQVSGPSVAITGASSARASLVAVNTTRTDVTLQFRLTVTDQAGKSASDTCSVVVLHGGGTSGNGGQTPHFDSRDIGAPDRAGSYSEKDGKIILSGSGADIWDTRDQFRFAYTQVTGDCEITARVQSLDNTNAWAKAGVMIRDTLDAGSANAMVLVTPEERVSFQMRMAPNENSFYTSARRSSPFFVKLKREGNVFMAFCSGDGNQWEKIGSRTIPMGEAVYLGLGVTSHNSRVLCNAEFDQVKVWSETSGNHGGQVTPFTSQAIGNPALQGSLTETGGHITLTGGGADIWDNADQFQFAYQAVSGDCEITARVDSLSNTSNWAKAGVMMRETLDGSSRHAMVVVTPTEGIAFQSRRDTGSWSTHTGASGAAPGYVKLTRKGAVLTAFCSTDGAAWTEIGARTIEMGNEIYIGLAVTSHHTGALCTADFAQVTVVSETSGGSNSGSVPTFTSQDIGNPASQGSFADDGGRITLTGGGADIWGSVDQFQFAYQAVTGDCEITARVDSLSNTSSWAKAGVMMRETLDASSRHAMVVISPTSGIAFQSRRDPGAWSEHTGATGAAPGFVKLTRKGAVLTSFCSTDGAAWSEIGSRTIGMGNEIYIGLAVTSHHAGALCTAVFKNVEIRKGDLR